MPQRKIQRSFREHLGEEMAKNFKKLHQRRGRVYGFGPEKSIDSHRKRKKCVELCTPEGRGAQSTLAEREGSGQFLLEKTPRRGAVLRLSRRKLVEKPTEERKKRGKKGVLDKQKEKIRLAVRLEGKKDGVKTGRGQEKCLNGAKRSKRLPPERPFSDVEVEFSSSCPILGEGVILYLPQDEK